MGKERPGKAIADVEDSVEDPHARCARIAPEGREHNGDAASHGSRGLQRLPIPGRRPEARPQCPCGWERQTPKHVVMFCPRLQGRDGMLARTGTGDYHTLLTMAKGLRAATSWLIRAGVLAQFSTAKEMAEEDRGALGAIPSPVGPHCE